MSPTEGQWPGQGHPAACTLQVHPLPGRVRDLRLSAVVSAPVRPGVPEALLSLHLLVERFMVHTVPAAPDLQPRTDLCGRAAFSTRRGTGSPNAGSKEGPRAAGGSMRVSKWGSFLLANAPGLLAACPGQPQCVDHFGATEISGSSRRLSEANWL